MDVRVSKTYAERDNLVERGVPALPSKAESRCERTVVLPEPDSPLSTQISHVPRKNLGMNSSTYKNTTA